MYFIEIRFEDGRETVCLKNLAEGQSLLEVCLTNGVQLNHECGGICSCSTCRIYITKGAEHNEVASKREKDLLAKKKIADPATRLSCQCLLLEGSGEINIIIPKQNL